jgi:hypothetical protein
MPNVSQRAKRSFENVAGDYLFQRRIDRRELIIQVRTKTINDRDDRKRDTCCDQAVFDRSCTRLIGQKIKKKTLHVLSSRFALSRAP